MAFSNTTYTDQELVRGISRLCATDRMARKIYMGVVVSCKLNIPEELQMLSKQAQG